MKRFKCAKKNLLLLLAGFFTASAPSAFSAPIAVLTQGYTNARLDSTTHENILTPANVKENSFGKLFTIPLNANVNGQVLYVPHLSVMGATQNAIFVYTSNNQDNSPCGVYAFNADNGKQLWYTPLPNSARFTTDCPVIDLHTHSLIAVTKTLNDNGRNFLRAFDLSNGRQISVVQVQASVPGTGDGSVDGRVYFDGNHGNGFFHANERPGLLLHDGLVYLAFAYNTDQNPYHGWVLAYKQQGGTFVQKYVFCTTPNGSSRTTPGGGDGGIWMDGLGMSVGPKGNLYCSLGNGTFDVNTGGIDYGMSYLKLTPQLKVVDYFSPHDEASQSAADRDTGNTGPIPLPGTDDLFVGATKFGAGFLMKRDNMGHFAPEETNGREGISGAALRFNGLSSDRNIGQNPICWPDGELDQVYLWPKKSGIEQMTFDRQFNDFLETQNLSTNPGTGRLYPPIVTRVNNNLTSGGELSVSSDGTSGGILWALGYNSVLYALNPANVSQDPIWSSAMDAARDSIPSVGHFQFLTVDNGKVYVPTGSASIIVYGLLPK